MTAAPIPAGYHSVTPYLIVQGAEELIAFLRQAFGGEEMRRTMLPDGTIMHAEIRVGDSPIMLGEAGGPWQPMPASIHLYVEDADAVYRRALKAGATSLREPRDEFFGDRMGGVKDCHGNLWWIATHKEDLSNEELQRRTNELMQQGQRQETSA